MESVMRQIQLCSLVLAATVFTWVPGDAPAEDVVERSWQISRLIMLNKGRRTERGLAIYSTDTDRSGAAFRCDRGKLYAVFTLKGISILSYMTRRSARPRDVQMVLQIDDGETLEQKWVSMFNGKLYMARSRSTTSALYRAVVAGKPVVLTGPRRDPVSIDYPAVNQPQFDSFLSRCNLNPANFPYPPGTQAPAPAVQTE